ncbi:MAG: hypothetical protein WCC66_04480 [Rhizobiaceae bacterium]
MQGLTGRLISKMAALAALGALMTSGCAAAEITMECPQGEAGAKLSLVYEADTLTVNEADSSATLAGSIQLDPSGIFAIYGSGPTEAKMAEPGALDACVAASLTTQGAVAGDSGALGYAINACSVKLAPSATMQKVQAQYTLTSIDKGKATLFIQRQYFQPSVVTGKPLQIDVFPMRECAVLAGP